MTHPRQRASDQKSAASHSAETLLHSASELYCEQYAEDLLSGYYDGVIGIDKQGLVTFINKTASKLTGWSSSQAQQQPCQDIFQFADNLQQHACESMIEEILQTGQILGPLQNQQIITRQQQTLNVDFSISPLDENTAILMFHEVRDNNSASAQPLVYPFSHDSLTHLANRTTLQKTIHQLHEHYQNNHCPYSILLLDVDRFKLINDNFGHHGGDKLLQLLAERLQYFIRDKDYIGRWGGEEFLCVLPDTDHETACQIAQRLCNEIAEEPFQLNEQKTIHATVSIGIASYPRDGNEPEQLFCVADSTLYHAKQNGRNRIHSSRQHSENIFSIGARLENALNEDRIVAVYQPIFDLRSGQQVAEEALARIQDKNGELVAAGQFIDAAVELQMVHRIDYQIMRKMIQRCAETFKQQRCSYPHFVNISADLLRHPQLVHELLEYSQQICQHCPQDQCNQQPVVIEITEQELLGEMDEVRHLLAPFIDSGMPLAIDDFGSGYSSFSYLADLPISYLKFDGALIKRVAFEDRAKKIITGIQRMAESLNLITIAEHIENQETLAALNEIGVAWGQGFFSARPAK